MDSFLDKILKELEIEHLRDNFIFHGVDESILHELTEFDLAELGIEKIGTRKKFLKHLRTIGITDHNSNFFEYLISLYDSASNSTLKLIHLCDLTEILFRFYVSIFLSIYSSGKSKSEKIRKLIQENIELPTFGRWINLAIEIRKFILIHPSLDLLDEYYNTSLLNFSGLKNIDNVKNTENSIVMLRNYIAHGGIKNSGAMSHLLTIWDKKIKILRPFSEIFNHFKFEKTNLVRINNEESKLDQDFLILEKQGYTLNLTPFILFNENKENGLKFISIYSKKSDYILEYTPLNNVEISSIVSTGSVFKMFTKYFISSPQEIRKINDDHEDFFLRKANRFIGRNEYIDEINFLMKKKSYNYFIISGKTGTGKTHILGKIFQQSNNQKTALNFDFFKKESPLSSIENILNGLQPNYNEVFEIYLDNIEDILKNLDETKEFFNRLSLNINIKVILTCNTKYLKMLTLVLKNKTIINYKIKEISNDDFFEIYNDRMNILRKNNPNLNNDFFLDLANSINTTFDGDFNRINNFIGNLIKSKNKIKEDCLMEKDIIKSNIENTPLLNDPVVLSILTILNILRIPTPIFVLDYLLRKVGWITNEIIDINNYLNQISDLIDSFIKQDGESFVIIKNRVLGEKQFLQTLGIKLIDNNREIIYSEFRNWKLIDQSNVRLFFLWNLPSILILNKELLLLEKIILDINYWTISFSEFESDVVLHFLEIIRVLTQNENLQLRKIERLIDNNFTLLSQTMLKKERVLTLLQIFSDEKNDKIFSQHSVTNSEKNLRFNIEEIKVKSNFHDGEVYALIKNKDKIYFGIKSFSNNNSILYSMRINEVFGETILEVEGYINDIIIQDNIIYLISSYSKLLSIKEDNGIFVVEVLIENQNSIFRKIFIHESYIYIGGSMNHILKYSTQSKTVEQYGVLKGWVYAFSLDLNSKLLVIVTNSGNIYTYDLDKERVSNEIQTGYSLTSSWVGEKIYLSDRYGIIHMFNSNTLFEEENISILDSGIYEFTVFGNRIVSTHYSGDLSLYDCTTESRKIIFTHNQWATALETSSIVNGIIFHAGMDGRVIESNLETGVSKIIYQPSKFLSFYISKMEVGIYIFDYLSSSISALTLDGCLQLSIFLISSGLIFFSRFYRKFDKIEIKNHYIKVKMGRFIFIGIIQKNQVSRFIKSKRRIKIGSPSEYFEIKYNYKRLIKIRKKGIINVLDENENEVGFFNFGSLILDFILKDDNIYLLFEREGVKKLSFNSLLPS